MEKEALLTIILQDIKELETLVNTFKGKSHIPDVFIQLSQSKTQGILDEIQLLASIKDAPEAPARPESTEKTIAAKPPAAMASPKVVLEKPAEQAISMPATNGNNTTVIGEMLGKDKPSFNERLVEKQEPASSKSQPPISDLRRAIGINDRFFFQRELFGGNTDLFNQTIDQLNNMDNLDTAMAFISTNFNWNPNNEAVTSFIALLRRRFIKK